MDRRSFLCVVASLASGARHAAWSTPLSPVEVRGAYGDPSDFWKTGARLDDIGVDAVFVPAGSVNEHMVARIRSEGARVFVDFPTFNGGRWLLGRVGEKEEPIREHLDAWPMDAAGDVMSPMLYHGRLDRDPGTWVTENVRWLTERLGTAGETAPRVWPIVQAFDRPRAVTATELENALRGARRGGATGVLFLSLSSMAASEAKTAVVRELYRNVLSGS